MLINLEWGHTSTSKAKILIIDDDKDITNLFSIFLEYNGYIVDAYTNTLEAFYNFRQNSHYLIVLDLKMPQMDGMTLYRKIKGRDDEVIVCFTTADISYIEDLRKGIIDIVKLFFISQYYWKNWKIRLIGYYLSKE